MVKLLLRMAVSLLLSIPLMMVMANRGLRVGGLHSQRRMGRAPAGETIQHCLRRPGGVMGLL